MVTGFPVTNMGNPGEADEASFVFVSYPNTKRDRAYQHQRAQSLRTHAYSRKHDGDYRHHSATDLRPQVLGHAHFAAMGQRNPARSLT